MIELDPLKCECCGGQIDRITMKCPYCGTAYARKSEYINVIVDRQGVHRLRCQANVPDEMVRRAPEVAKEYALDEMRKQIADSLLAYMKISTEVNPMSMCQIIRGEVKVVDPSFDY